MNDEKIVPPDSENYGHEILCHLEFDGLVNTNKNDSLLILSPTLISGTHMMKQKAIILVRTLQELQNQLLNSVIVIKYLKLTELSMRSSSSIL